MLKLAHKGRENYRSDPQGLGGFVFDFCVSWGYTDVNGRIKLDQRGDQLAARLEAVIIKKWAEEG